MKKQVILFMLSMVFLAGIVSGQITCGSPEDIIMRISGSTNAHGEVYNGAGNYVEEISYCALFGGPYSGSNPHQCGGSEENIVLRLSGLSNAHAEVSTESNYGTPVCYGDLTCVARPGPSSNCLAGEVEVVRLSGSTNAHLELGSLGNYNTRICCTAGASPPAGGDDLRWEDFAGNEIGQSNVGNIVRVIIEIPTFAGQTLTLEILEQEPGFDDSIETVSVDVDSNGFAVYEWAIDQSDLLGTETDNIWDFYFTVTDGSVILDSRSYADSEFDGYLHVNDFTNDNPPTANITGDIVHRGIYFINVPIELNHSSFDVEGPISSVSWTIENSTGIEYETSDESFDHIFLTGGQKIVTLEVEDSSGQTDSDQVAIVLISSPGMIAFVNDPSHNEIVNLSDGNGDGKLDLIVDFSGNDSYVIDSSVDVNDCSNGEIVCVAGSCPSTTENWPGGANCDAPIGLTGVLDKNFEALLFKWTFDDGSTRTGYGNVSGRKLYNVRSNSLNDKEATLNLTYDGFLLNEISYRFFTLGQCIEGGTNYVELDNEGNIINEYDTLVQPGACDLAGDGTSCCPVGFTCESEPGESGLCEPSGFNECSDYDTETDCDADPANAVVSDPLASVSGCELSDIFCECAWDSLATPDPECVFQVTNQTGIIINPEDDCTQYSCNYQGDSSECIDGKMTITSTANFIPGTCSSGPVSGSEVGCVDEVFVDVPCGQFNIELGFFDIRQMISAFLLIFVVYLIWHFVEKDKK
jgi:hypothetical protein